VLCVFEHELLRKHLVGMRESAVCMDAVALRGVVSLDELYVALEPSFDAVNTPLGSAHMEVAMSLQLISLFCVEH